MFDRDSRWEIALLAVGAIAECIGATSPEINRQIWWLFECHR
jgi:hypothetical protein